MSFSRKQVLRHADVALARDPHDLRLVDVRAPEGAAPPSVPASGAEWMVLLLGERKAALVSPDAIGTTLTVAEQARARSLREPDSVAAKSRHRPPGYRAGKHPPALPRKDCF
jgi:hypothetical protein